MFWPQVLFFPQEDLLFGGIPHPRCQWNFIICSIFRARASYKPSRTPLLVGRGYPPIYYQETKLNSGKSIVVFGCCPFFTRDLCVCYKAICLFRDHIPYAPRFLHKPHLWLCYQILKWILLGSRKFTLSPLLFTTRSSYMFISNSSHFKSKDLIIHHSWKPTVDGRNPANQLVW